MHRSTSSSSSIKSRAGLSRDLPYTDFMKTTILWLFAICAVPASAAVTLPPSHTVDWLTFGPADTFLQSNGLVAVQASLVVTEGFAFAESLTAENFDSAYWQSPVPFDSANSSTSAVEAISILVAPGASSTQFTLTLSATSGVFPYFLLAIGGLDAGSTSSVRVSANHILQGQVAGAFTLLGESIYDPGFGSYDTAFTWNAGLGTLTPDAGADGKTQFVFLQLEESGIESISIEFTSASPSLFGDEFVLALGSVTIPETSTSLITVLGIIFLTTIRRRA